MQCIKEREGGKTALALSFPHMKLYTGSHINTNPIQFIYSEVSECPSTAFGQKLLSDSGERSTSISSLLPYTSMVFCSKEAIRLFLMVLGSYLDHSTQQFQASWGFYKALKTQDPLLSTVHTGTT